MNADDDLRCSMVTAALGEPSAGTATFAERFVLVELPSPWPKPITSHPIFEESDIATLKAPGVRVLAVGRADDPDGRHSVITYVRSQGHLGYEGFEVLVDTEDLRETVLAEARGHADGTPPIGNAISGTDLLICTQGTHDRCCGRFGTMLYVDVHDRFGPDVRVWRTSHTGGHRFAPTGISLPDGVNWSGLDAGVLDAVMSRSGSAADLAQHVRGRSALKDRRLQIADAAALARYGWGWLDADITATLDADSFDGGDRAAVRLDADVPGEGPTSLTMVLEASEPIPVPPCGKPLTDAKKTSAQYRVVS